MNEAMRVLFVTPFVPSRQRPSPYHHITLLSQRHEIDLVCLVHDAQEEEALEPLRGACRLHPVRVRRGRAILRCGWNLASRTPLFAAYCQVPEFRAKVRELSSQSSYDVLHVQHLRAGWAAQNIPIPARVYDSQDCFSLLMKRLCAGARDPATKALYWGESLKMPGYEKRLLASFDAVTVCSPTDLAMLKSLCPGPSMRYLPNGVDLAHFASQGPREVGPHLLFIGRLTYLPNRDAAVFLVREILPKVRQRHPDAQLRIVGAGLPSSMAAEFSSVPGVEVAGHSEDVRVHLRWASVSVAPMRLGVGTNFKILEALASGLPVVTTPKGCEGLLLKPGQDACVARDAQGLADGISGLLSEPGQRESLSASGRAYVAKEHDWNTIVTTLEGIYRELLKR